MCLGEVRLQLQPAAVAGDGFVQLPLVPQGIGQVIVRFGIAWSQGQCPPPAGDRFGQISLFLQGVAQVVVGLGVVRLQLQGPAVAGDRLGNPVQGAMRFPQVVMEEGHAALQGDRPLNVLDGKVVLARLESDQPQKMNGVGMIRLHLQDLPIDLLGRLQPAALMVPDRNRQCLGNRCHGALLWRHDLPAAMGFKRTGSPPSLRTIVVRPSRLSKKVREQEGRRDARTTNLAENRKTTCCQAA